MKKEWWPEAHRLRDQGLRVGEIARQIGVTPSAVSKALNPEARAAYNKRTIDTRDRERHRAVDNAWRRKEAARGRCIECGDLMGVSYLTSPPATRTHVCRDCIKRAAEDRRRQIVEWWAAGESLRQIAERLGWSLGHVSVEFARMRDRGYDLPHRYNVARIEKAVA